jgi:hypothetical protein
VTTAKKTTAKPASSSARKVIGDAIAEGVTPERVKGIIDTAFGSEVVASAVCEECGGAMKVKIPDLKKQVDTLVSLLEQAEGRPSQNQPEATTIIIERPTFG